MDETFLYGLALQLLRTVNLDEIAAGDPVGFIVGAIFVGAMAHNRFEKGTKDLPLPRWRGLSSAIFYVGVQLAVYIALGRLILAVPEIGELLGVPKATPVTTGSSEGSFSPFLFAALLLTVLLPGYPLLSRADGYLQGYVTKVIGQPTALLALSRDLCLAPLCPSPEIMQGVEERLAAIGQPGQLDNVLREDSARSLWARTELMRLVVERLSQTSAVMYQHLYKQEQALGEQQRRIAIRLSLEKLYGMSEAMGVSHEFQGELNQLNTQLKEDLQSNLEKAALLLARAIMDLRGKLEHRSPVKELGLTIHQSPPFAGTDSTSLAFLTSLVAILPIGAGALAAGVAPSGEVGFVLHLFAGAAVTAVAAAGALWTLRRRYDSGLHGASIYLGAGGTAAGASGIFLVLGVLITGTDFDAMLTGLYSIAPALAAFFLLGVALAWRSDRPTIETSPVQTRLLDVVTVGVSFAVGGVYMGRAAEHEGIGLWFPGPLPPYAGYWLMAGCLITGVGLGLVIPAWVRHQRMLSEKTE